MKKTVSLLLSVLLLMSLLTACGGSETKEPVNADLTAFYDSLAAEYEWVSEGMMDMTADPELMNSFFPGLSDIPARQLVLRTPMMSAVVNEIGLMECESEADAAKAAEIFSQRVTAQAEGGAWYPESMEAWSKAKVITHGCYVAMIANGAAQSEIEGKFNALFE